MSHSVLKRWMFARGGFWVGVATFANLSIDKAGTGYTLTASATGLTGATSGAFNVVAPVSVSAGFGQTCGITPSAAYCWGLNNFGQLGSLRARRCVRHVRAIPESP